MCLIHIGCQEHSYEQNRFPTCGKVCSNGPIIDLEEVITAVILLKGKMLWSMKWEDPWRPASKQLTHSRLDGGSQKIRPASPQNLWMLPPSFRKKIFPYESGDKIILDYYVNPKFNNKCPYEKNAGDLRPTCKRRGEDTEKRKRQQVTMEVETRVSRHQSSSADTHQKLKSPKNRLCQELNCASVRFFPILWKTV